MYIHGRYLFLKQQNSTMEIKTKVDKYGHKYKKNGSCTKLIINDTFVNYAHLVRCDIISWWYSIFSELGEFAKKIRSSELHFMFY